MNVRKLFRGVSRRLVEDFKGSAQVKHKGSRGTVRETLLRAFLENRLPKRFSIGSGEIVSSVRETSSQEDLIIYDGFGGLPLFYSDTVQVFPIESVYGIVEVKSELSKQELFDSLNKITSVKSIAPNDVVQHQFGAMFTGTRRPAPFGIVFAYSLAKNSIDSLAKNLREWEASVEAHLWPNYVAVLGEGVILHNDDKPRNCIHSTDITSHTNPIGVHYGEDSLFQFYSALVDIATSMQLGPTRLLDYYDMPERVGQYLVKNHDRLQKFDRATGQLGDDYYRLKDSFLISVIDWAHANGRMASADAVRYMFGNLPDGETDADHKGATYIYNPDNLIHGEEAVEELARARKERRSPAPNATNCLPLLVNRQRVLLPFSYILDENLVLAVSDI